MILDAIELIKDYKNIENEISRLKYALEIFEMKMQEEELSDDLKASMIKEMPSSPSKSKNGLEGQLIAREGTMKIVMKLKSMIKQKQKLIDYANSCLGSLSIDCKAIVIGKLLHGETHEQIQSDCKMSHSTYWRRHEEAFKSLEEMKLIL